ncbi:hypothetical protein RMCBS344292_09620 [Rhizopus microsporus]|nr:hypothetical protein RMCBS344292_09620 [Rhizopus microsporus]
MPILVAPRAKGWTTSYIAVPWLITSAGVYVAEKYKRTLTLTAWFKTAFIECMATDPQGDQIRRRGVQRLLRILFGLAICRYVINPLLPEVPQTLFQYPWYSIPSVYYTFLMGFKGYLLMNASTVSLSAIQTICGIDLLEPFDKPFLATSPKDFWSRRWNSIVRNLFIKYLYTANDRSVNKRLYVFYFSASMHEIIMTIVSRQMTFEQFCFFMVHGLAVTAQVTLFRSVKLPRPLATVLTLLFFCLTGKLFLMPFLRYEDMAYFLGKHSYL